MEQHWQLEVLEEAFRNAPIYQLFFDDNGQLNEDEFQQPGQYSTRRMSRFSLSAMGTLTDPKTG